MSIVITGLEMPKERESFNLTIKYNGTVLDTEMGMQVAEAYELPPHGRLIDVDYADDYAYDELELANSYLTGWEAARAMQKIYQNAPTIIPAEKDTDIQKRFLQNWHEDGE